MDSQLADTLTTWRRHLHANPGLTLHEGETAAFVVQKLREMGVAEIAEGVGGHGVVATLRRGGTGGTPVQVSCVVHCKARFIGRNELCHMLEILGLDRGGGLGCAWFEPSILFCHGDALLEDWVKGDCILRPMVRSKRSTDRATMANLCVSNM